MFRIKGWGQVSTMLVLWIKVRIGIDSVDVMNKVAVRVSVDNVTD